MVASLQPGVAYRARAPLRLSFGGGGTEIPPYLTTYGGVVINSTIDRYVYATLTATETGVSFEASDCALRENLSAQGAHELAGNGIKLPLHRAVYNRIMRTYNGGEALNLHLQTYCDAPVGSGLGTSSTLTVAMLRCFDEALGLNLGEYEIASLAHDIERSDLNLSGGYQDHYAAAFGGFNFIEFRADGEVIVNPLRLRPWVIAELEFSLILCFTGVSRESAAIIDAQQRSLKDTRKAVEAMHSIKELAHRMKDCLLTGRIEEFASALHESWLLKRSTADAISNSAIDEMYEQARGAGAMGGKISGAGGGGFLMLFAAPARRADLLKMLDKHPGDVYSCCFVKDGARAWRIRK